MAGIRLNKELARQRFEEALTSARSGNPLPKAWIETTERVAGAKSKTFLPVLGTILLAKATDRQVDAFALQVGDGHKSYSARGLAQDVFVPACVHAGVDIRTRGGEPLNNQPFFGQSRISRDMKVKDNVRGDFLYLYECIERADFLEGDDAIQALAAFLHSRLGAAPPMQPLANFEGRISLLTLLRVLSEFMQGDSEGGRVGQAAVAAALSVAFDDVRTRRVNDPSRTWPGDVGAFVGGALVLSVEVKQKLIRDTDVHQFAQELVKHGLDRGLVAALAQSRGTLREQDLHRLVYEHHHLDVDFAFDVGDLVLTSSRLSRSSLSSSLSKFVNGMRERLTELEVSQARIDAWENLWREAIEADDIQGGRATNP